MSERTLREQIEALPVYIACPHCRGNSAGAILDRDAVLAVLAGAPSEGEDTRDSARLDWLADDAGQRWSAVWRAWSGEGPFRDTLRAAIDLARTPPGTPETDR